MKETTKQNLIFWVGAFFVFITANRIYVNTGSVIFTNVPIIIFILLVWLFNKKEVESFVKNFITQNKKLCIFIIAPLLLYYVCLLFFCLSTEDIGIQELNRNLTTKSLKCQYQKYDNSTEYFGLEYRGGVFYDNTGIKIGYKDQEFAQLEIPKENTILNLRTGILTDEFNRDFGKCEVIKKNKRIDI